MRKVKLEDLKKGVEIQWYEHGRKYIIESVDKNLVVLADYNVSMVSVDDVLKNCHIKDKKSLICIGQGYNGLTYGKKYEANNTKNSYYEIVDDYNKTVLVSKYLFKTEDSFKNIRVEYNLPEIKNGYPPMPSVKPPKETPLSDQYPHYYKDVSNLKVIDVYRVLELFEVNDPCIQHAIKKLLAIGNRGVKDHDRDFREVMDTLKRYEEMRSEYDA